MPIFHIFAAIRGPTPGTVCSSFSAWARGGASDRVLGMGISYSMTYQAKPFAGTRTSMTAR